MTARIEHAPIVSPPGHPTARPSGRPGRPGRHLLTAALVTCVASCTPAQAPQGTATPRDATSGAVARAQFNEQGHAMRPVEWRKWVYVGTPLTPNALNKGKAAFPEFHNVYVEPGAYDSYMKTGTWAQGTQIAKELVSVQAGDAPDGSSIASSGRGYFQGEFQGLELLVKDQQRFAKEPGGWAFFSFGHKPEPYDATATILPASACSGCHEDGAETDYVFTQYYPALRERAAKTTK